MPEESIFTPEEQEKLLQQGGFNTGDKKPVTEKARTTDEVTIQDAERRDYGPPTLNTPSFYEFHGINDPESSKREDQIADDVAFWVNKALEEQENELDIPDNDFIKEHVVPMTYRIGAPLAYPAAVAGAANAAKWTRRMKYIKAGKLLTRTAGKAPTPWTLAGFVAGEAAFGIAGEYVAQKHLIANEYQDEIQPGHLISAGIVNSYTLSGVTKIGTTLKPWAQNAFQGTKMHKWGKALDSPVVTYGGYALRGGTVGAVSSSIDQSYQILTDEEKKFLGDWNWEYFGKAAAAGMGVDPLLNLSGRAVKRAATSKIVRNSKTFKKGAELHNKVVNKAREKELKAIEKALGVMDKKIEGFEKELNVTMSKGGVDAAKFRNEIQRKWLEATGQKRKLNEHLDDAREIYQQTFFRLREMEEFAVKKINEETYASFINRQKRVAKFYDIKGFPVKPNVQGELILYKVDGQGAKLGQVTLSTQSPKQGKAVSVRIPQSQLKLLNQLDNGSVIFTAQQKQFETALNKTPKLLKFVLEGEKAATKTKLTKEDLEQTTAVERLIRSKTADAVIDPKQHAQDVKDLLTMARSTLGSAGDVSVKQAEIYQRWFPYVKHLIKRLPDIQTDPKAVDEVLVILERTMEMEAATGGLDFKVATQMLAMKERTPREMIDFSKETTGRTMGENTLRRQNALQELKEAVEAFKVTKELSGVEKAAEEVAGTSRQIQRQNKAIGKQNKKELKDKWRNVLAKVMELHNGAKGATNLSATDRIVDAVLTARTSTLLMAPDTVLLGPVTYGINGLVVQPFRQTGRNVATAFGWGGPLKDASLGQKIAYSLTDTPINLSRNNFYLQNLLALTADKTGWANALNTLKMGGRSTLLPRSSGYLDVVDTSKSLTMRDIIRGKRDIRRQESPGVGGFVMKQAPGFVADEINWLLKQTGSVMGAADEPLFYALHRANLAAEGQRQAIVSKIPKVHRNAFIKDFVERQFLREGSGATINEAAEGIQSANQTLRTLGRGPKYGTEGVDYRSTMWERFASGGGEKMSLEKGLAQAVTMRVLFPVFGIPVRLAGQSMDFLFAPVGSSIGVPIRKGLEATGVDRFGPYRKELNALDTKIKVGNKALDGFKSRGETEQARNMELALSTARNSLNRTHALRDQEVAENAGAAVLAGGVLLLAWKLAENGEMTGTGSFLTAEQKKKLQFKSFRQGGESYKIEGVDIATGEGGRDIRYSDRIKMAMAFTADLKLWVEMKDAGLLTEENPQDFDEFVAGWLTPALQEQSVANTLNAIADIAVGSPDQREAATRRLGASMTMTPAFFRKYQQVNQKVYQQDITEGPMISSTYKYGAGLDTKNYKRDLFHRKVEKESISPLGFWLRSAAKQATKTDALESIVRRDSLLRDGGGLSRQGGRQTIRQATLKDFIKKDGEETLFQVYSDLVNTVEHPDYGGKTQEEVLFDLIDSSAWQKKYNEGYYTKREEDEEGRPFNEGIQEINKVRRAFLNLAEEKLLDEEELLGGSYINKKQENIYQFLYNLREE